MLRNRVFYVLLLFLAVMLYIFTNTYYTLMMLMICIVLPVVSVALMLVSRKNLKISLRAPAAANKDDAAVTYTLENTGRLPVAKVVFSVKLENQMTGTYRKRRINAAVGGRETVTAQLSLSDSKVGAVIISTEKIRVYDAFGLVSFGKSNLEDEMMIIHPDMREVNVSMARPVETNVDGSRYSPDRPGQDINEIFALREYAAGDEIRKIHWKLSGKLDKTVVRDFSLPLNYSVFLLLELVRGSEELVDAQVEIFLSLSAALLENGINHNIGWYDAADGIFHVKELGDIEDFELASSELLSSYAPEESGDALDYYAASGYRDQRNILIYVVTDPDVDKIAELEVRQRMQTVMIYEDKAEVQTVCNAIDAIGISTQEAADALPEIII